MNKRYFLAIIPILMIGLVSANLISYFGQITKDVDVNRAITVTGGNCNAEGVCSEANVVIAGGETVSSDVYTVTSQTSVYAPLSISTVVSPSEGGISSVNEYNLKAEGTQGSESRIFIDMSGKTLNDLNTLEFMQYVTAGYIGHADIKLDLNGDGVYTSGTDDAIVVEYDKVKTPSDQVVADMDYARNQWVNTFDDKGILDGSSKGWLTSRDAGPVGGVNFISATLNDWKAGPAGVDYRGISGTTKLIGIEIEVDNWILDSEEKIKDIKLNGNNVLVTLQPSGFLKFDTATTFSTSNFGSYDITTTITPYEEP